jgi:hypothetical protein
VFECLACNLLQISPLKLCFEKLSFFKMCSQNAGNAISKTQILKSPLSFPLECGGTLTHSKGNITTANYPNKYPPKQDCIWIIKVPVHKLLKLRFLSFDVERHSQCRYDYVEIRDGSSQRSTLLGTFCGNTLPSKWKYQHNKI